MPLLPHISLYLGASHDPTISLIKNSCIDRPHTQLTCFQWCDYCTMLPNQLDNTLSPQAPLLSLVITAYFLQPRAMPPLYSAGCLHGYSTGTAPCITCNTCSGLLWTASISYVDYNSLVEGLSPPSFKGLPSLPIAIFRQKGRLTKTLNSK